VGSHIYTLDLLEGGMGIDLRRTERGMPQ